MRREPYGASTNKPPFAAIPIVERGERDSGSFVAKTKLIVNLTRGHAVCVGELADRPLSRMRGLIGRPGLPAGEGLLLSPAPSIHTAFMRFPIDALFLDRNLRVLAIVERLRPWRFAAKRRARAVLELSAGESARRGVEVGDRLELRDRAEDEAPVDIAAAARGADGAPAVREAAPAWHGRQTAPLQPLSVLIISPDRRFGTVMSLLLARRNCSVATTANAGRVGELVARENVDVVIVDAGGLPAAAAMAAVAALERPVGLVLVADDADVGSSDGPMLAKWGPFEQLLGAIDLAVESRGTEVGRS